jgi:hypothetical protein
MTTARLVCNWLNILTKAGLDARLFFVKMPTKKENMQTLKKIVFS